MRHAWNQQPTKLARRDKRWVSAHRNLCLQTLESDQKNPWRFSSYENIQNIWVMLLTDLPPQHYQGLEFVLSDEARKGSDSSSAAEGFACLGG